jgi:hypothetical protein
MAWDSSYGLDPKAISADACEPLYEGQAGSTSTLKSVESISKVSKTWNDIASHTD